MGQNISKVTILCTDSTCRYNSGGGYYGVCHHPRAADLLPYGGIDRYYKSTCDNREVIIDAD